MILYAYCTVVYHVLNRSFMMFFKCHYVILLNFVGSWSPNLWFIIPFVILSKILILTNMVLAMNSQCLKHKFTYNFPYCAWTHHYPLNTIFLIPRYFTWKPVIVQLSNMTFNHLKHEILPGFLNWSKCA